MGVDDEVRHVILAHNPEDAANYREALLRDVKLEDCVILHPGLLEIPQWLVLRDCVLHWTGHPGAVLTDELSKALTDLVAAQGDNWKALRDRARNWLYVKGRIPDRRSF